MTSKFFANILTFFSFWPIKSNFTFIAVVVDVPNIINYITVGWILSLFLYCVMQPHMITVGWNEDSVSTCFVLKSDHENSWYIWAKFALISPLHAGIFKSTPKWFWEPQFHFSLNVILPKIWENRVDLTNFRQNMSKLVREKWNCGSQSHLGVDLKIPACRGDIKANLAQIYQEYSWLDFSTKPVETKSSFQPTVPKGEQKAAEGGLIASVLKY